MTGFEVIEGGLRNPELQEAKRKPVYDLGLILTPMKGFFG